MNAKKFGTKGELTEQLAQVLKALWTCQDVSDHSSAFKAVVERYGAQFRSSTQHDAQEFLFWLLDKVHEDLNTASKRKYKSIKNTFGRPDEVLAAETLANHIRCNNSFVQAVFQAQFRSSLTCPRCQKQSNTFDPFHCISVQLPQLTQQSIYVKVIYATQQPKQVKLGLGIPHGSSVIVLRERLVQETNLTAEQIILTEIGDTGFNRILCDSHPLSSVSEIDPIYCIEAPKLNENTPHILLLIANARRNSTADEPTRFGTPFCMQVARDISFVELQKALLKQMKSVLKPEVFAYTSLEEMFKIHLVDPSADPDTYIEPVVEHPLFTEMIDMALSVFPSDAGPAHVKLLLEWPEPDKYFSSLDDHCVDHESVTRLQKQPAEVSSLTLEDCLHHYTKAETLSTEDAWRCPHCQKYLPVVKTLGLWSLPDILVIHFKRFRQQQLRSSPAAKLTTMVEFPLTNFDMSKHLARAAGAASNMSDVCASNGSVEDCSPWKKNSKRGLYSSQCLGIDNRYDLYAVCYHQGDTLETGHYTAACKNPYDHQWYKFDDQKVTPVLSENIQEDIVNNEAYILFYQRRKADSSECSGASSSSSEHWVSRIAAESLNGIATKSSTLKSTISTTAGDTVVEHDEALLVATSSTNNETTSIEPEKPEQSPKAVTPTSQLLPNGEKLNIEQPTKENVTDDETTVLSIIEEKFINQQSVQSPSTNTATITTTTPVTPSSEPIEIKMNGQHSPMYDDCGSDDSRLDEKEDEFRTPVKSFDDDIVMFREKKPKPFCKITWNGKENDRFDFQEIISQQHSSMPNSFLSKMECDAVCMIRGANSCSKDTLLFIDQPSHNFLSESDDMMDNRRSLWVSDKRNPLCH